MVNVFFRNVFLVIIFGVAHALIFLPTVLDTVMPLVAALDRRRQVTYTLHRNVQTTQVLKQRRGGTWRGHKESDAVI